MSYIALPWTDLVPQLALHSGADREAVRARLRILRRINEGVKADMTDCIARCAEFNAALRPVWQP